MAELRTAGTEMRGRVRDKYAAAARAAAASGSAAGVAGCCGPTEVALTDTEGRQVFGDSLYTERDADGAGTALSASLGCGVPTAVADLHPGETVLDLGSGAGADVFISAGRVGAAGRVIGLDMTDEMLGLAQAHAAAADVTNVEFVKGHIEAIPLASETVDVVLSNCVINLSSDKPRVLAEAARVLRPGGRLAVSDVIADEDMDAATRAGVAEWTGCIAGALSRAEFEDALAAAGLVEVEIRETHRVHEQAAAAIIRARKPARVNGGQAT